jgi:deoxyinosine 3'endonuclease (endonuclease V)
MKIPRTPHRWSVTPRLAIAIQKELATKVLVVEPRKEMRFIDGFDAAFSADGRDYIAAVVLWDAQSQTVVEERLAARPKSALFR